MPDWEGKSIRRDPAISDYHRALPAFQLQRYEATTFSGGTTPAVYRGSRLSVRFSAVAT